MLTVNHSIEVYAQDGKAFPDSVVRVLKFELHDGDIDFDNYNAGETGD